jgi:O-antigen ligase
VFSFYSDAGQFGASQAMMALLSGILAVGPFSLGRRILYWILAVVFFLGFAISGTRGALAVPLFGGLAYLITTRNFKVLFAGVSAMVLVFVMLKYTFMFQGVEQVRRMRTALDPNNRSLEVRLENQITFGRYLADKPFGGGIGTAGFWGARFNPNSLMANTATDSWYVKIWAETGIVGLAIHLSFLGFVLGKGGAICMGLQDPRRKTYAMAIYASIVGVVFSSYGNQVFGQMPTGMIMNLAIPFLFLIPTWYEKNSNS